MNHTDSYQYILRLLHLFNYLLIGQKSWFFCWSEASLGRKLFKADDPSAVERWLRRGADVWQRDSAGNVPLHVASKEVAAWK